MQEEAAKSFFPDQPSDSDSELDAQIGGMTAFSPTSSVQDFAKALSNPDDISISSFSHDMTFHSKPTVVKTPTTSAKKKQQVLNPTPKKQSKRKGRASGSMPLATTSADHNDSAMKPKDTMNEAEKRNLRQRLDDILAPLNAPNIETPYYYPTPWGYYPIMLQPICNITAREDLLTSMQGNVGANQPSATPTTTGYIPLSNLPPPGVIPPQFSNYLLSAGQLAPMALVPPHQPTQGTPTVRSMPSRNGSTRTSFDSCSSMSSGHSQMPTTMPFPPNIIPMPITPTMTGAPSRCTCAECYNYYPMQGQAEPGFYW